MRLLSLPFHHGEPTDPTLLEWITDKLHELVGLGPWPVVVILGVLIVSVPAALALLAWRWRRQSAG